MTHRRMLMLIGSAAVALVVVGVVPAAAQTRRDSGFRAAAAKVDITPETSQWLSGYQPRRSEGIHDRIYHRVVALESGDTQFFLISSDIMAAAWRTQSDQDDERLAGIAVTSVVVSIRRFLRRT